MTENIIILAGGASSRMKKSSDRNLSPQKIAQANKLSKGLIELRGKPFLSYLLDNILKAEFKNIYIITGENSQMFRKAFENNPNFKSLKIRYLQLNTSPIIEKNLMVLQTPCISALINTLI